MNEPLSPSQSTHEFVRGFSSITIAQYDLITPTPKDPVLSKARMIRPWELTTVDHESYCYFPTLPHVFRAGLQRQLLALTSDKEDVTGFDLLTSYEAAAETVTALSRQFRTIFSM